MTPSCTINTPSAEATHAVGRQIGEGLHTALVIALFGDLGAGKTVLVQGLGEGLAVPPQYYITSPTYTLINEYPGRLPLFHVDLYRLDGAHEVDDDDFDDNIGLLDIFTGKGVVALEWAERCLQFLPEDHLQIEIRIVDDFKRNLVLTARGNASARLLRRISTKGSHKK